MFRSNPKILPVRTQVSVGLTNDGLLVIEAPDGVALLLTPGLARQVAQSLASLADDASIMASASGFSALLKLGGDKPQ